MADLTAYCGINCADCGAYQATQAQDTAWKERVIEEWKAAYGLLSLEVKDVTCDGCTANTGVWSSHCYECNIRLCGVERGVATCAECPDYACDKLAAFFAMVPGVRENLEARRK